MENNVEAFIVIYESLMVIMQVFYFMVVILKLPIHDRWMRLLLKEKYTMRGRIMKQIDNMERLVHVSDRVCIDQLRMCRR